MSVCLLEKVKQNMSTTSISTHQYNNKNMHEIVNRMDVVCASKM